MRREDNQFSQEQRDTRQGMEKSDLLFVDNYGGINTTSPSVNCPYSDSPDMLNMDIGVSGILSKRLGSFIREEFTTDPRGFIMTTYKLVTGETLLVMKVGTSIAVYVAPGKDKNNLNRAVELVTYTDVFAPDSSTEKPTMVWTQGIYGFGDTLVMTTKSTNPIFVTIFQERVVGDGNTTIDIQGDFRSRYATATNSALVYTNSSNTTTVEPLTNISFSTPTTTLTFGNNVASGQVGTMLTVNWSWGTEAVKRTRDQIHASTFRFNTSVNADAAVEVPEGIRQGLQSDTDIWQVTLGNTLTYNNYLAFVESAHDTTGGGFTFTSPPTSATEYVWSTLSYTDGTDYAQRGTNYILFGGIAGAGTNPPTPVFINRIVPLYFNGLQTVQANEVGVVDDRGQAWTQRTTNSRVAGSASVRNWFGYTTGLVVDTTGGTTSIQALAFVANVPTGISSEFVEIYYANLDNVGSNAVTSYSDYNLVGTLVPLYGFSNICNTFIGQFPTFVGQFQNRLVFGGVPLQPMTIQFSNVGSEGSRFRFQNYESTVFSDPTLATEPISVTLEGREDDRVVGFIGWYDSLFVFTERSVRRIFGGNTVAISNTNISQTVIAEVGCKSPHGFVATDSSILFVSDSGLYAINTTDTSGGFDAMNLGIKVEKLFNSNAEISPSSTWAYYNQIRDLVFIGLSSNNDNFLPSRLLTYYNRRSAFGEYALYNGLFVSAHGASDTERDFIAYVQRDTAVTSSPSSSSVVVILEQNIENLNTDLTSNPSAASLISGLTTNFFNPSITHTIDNGQRIVSTEPINQSGLLTRQGFKTLPLNNFYEYLDVVYDNGVFETALTGGTDYLRYPFQQSLYLNVIPYTTGHTIEIDLLDERGYRPVVLTEDTLVLAETTGYTVGTSSGLLTVTKADADSDSVYYLGTSIPAWHFTPTLLQDLPLQFKRAVHYLGYYDNRIMHDYYRATDANSSASQESSAVSDRYKTESGVSIGILYNDARSGVFQLELYGTEDLTWDVSLFDLPSEGYRNQLNDVVRLVEPIIGVGYSIQVCNFNFGTERFALIGYKVKQRLKGKNTTRWY